MEWLITYQIFRHLHHRVLQFYILVVRLALFSMVVQFSINRYYSHFYPLCLLFYFYFSFVTHIQSIHQPLSILVINNICDISFVLFYFIVIYFADRNVVICTVEFWIKFIFFALCVLCWPVNLTNESQMYQLWSICYEKYGITMRILAQQRY